MKNAKTGMNMHEQGEQRRTVTNRDERARTGTNSDERARTGTNEQERKNRDERYGRTGMNVAHAQEQGLLICWNRVRDERRTRRDAVAQYLFAVAAERRNRR
ncbi:hypothetical protein SESBI_00480 [Sesbania bispinosa]|nr:hypothetical protein SESBI_00480 [Sesbania bispinosa]